MKKDQKHINYTAQDIKRYNTGKMSTQEMHEFEKAALEDSFLADAIEGYTYTASANSDLAELKQRLQQKITKKRDKPILGISGQWLRVAALLIFLAGAGWLGYYFNFNSAGTEIAKEGKSPQERNLKQQESNSSSGADANSGIDNLQPDTASVAITSRKQPAVGQSKVVSETSDRRQSRSVTSYTAEENRTPAIANSNAPDIAKENEGIQLRSARAFKSDSTVNAVASEATINAERSKKMVELNSGTIRGQVVNTKGEALPNASVTINNSQTKTLTDKQGYFTFPVKDSNGIASVAYVGYEAIRVRLKNIDSINKIVLKESDASLSEVVVVGNNVKRKKANLPENNKELPEPVNGWAQFEEYISKNLKNDSKVHGEVHLSFNINKQGMPEKIKVEIPLCIECDKEAIRLLKNGPKWKKANDTRGRVAIIF